jgi:anti-sigma B factor antagonist
MTEDSVSGVTHIRAAADRRVDDVWIVDLEGSRNLDEEASLINRVNAIIRSGGRKLILNAGRLSSVDSTGLGELARAHQLVHENDGRALLVNVSARLHRYLETTSLIAFFDLAPTEAAALVTLAGDD